VRKICQLIGSTRHSSVYHVREENNRANQKLWKLVIETRAL